MLFHFTILDKKHTLEAIPDKKSGKIKAILNHQVIEWDQESDEIDSPRVLKFEQGQELRVQYYRKTWYATLDGNPIEGASSVAKDKLVKLSTIVYAMAGLQLVIGIFSLFFQQNIVIFLGLFTGISCIVSSYLLSQKKNTLALYALFILCVLEIIAVSSYMFIVSDTPELYNNSPVAVFNPVMRFLIGLFLITQLIPGVHIMKEIVQETKKS